MEIFEGIPAPLLPSFFIRWMTTPDSRKVFQRYKDKDAYKYGITVEDIRDRAEEVGATSIDITSNFGVVKADYLRPYIIINVGNNPNTVYLGLHTLNTNISLQNTINKYDGIIDKDLLIIHHEIATNILNHYSTQLTQKITKPQYPLSEKLDGNSINRLLVDRPITYEDALKPFQNINAAQAAQMGQNRIFGKMIYYNLNMGSGAWPILTDVEFQNYYGRQVQSIYDIQHESVCWGDMGDNSEIYYIDELLGISGSRLPPFINWLNNPLLKSIQEYNEMQRLEAIRVAKQKRVAKINTEMPLFNNYETRRAIRAHNKTVALLKGRVSDGLYFNLPLINYIVHKWRSNDEDVFGNQRMNQTNMKIGGILNQIKNFTSQEKRINHNWWHIAHQFMEDVAGLDYNLATNDTVYNWTTWAIRDAQVQWFDELIASGIEVSHYRKASVEQSHYGSVDIAEDTIIFDWSKKGGLLSKNKYYSKIVYGVEQSVINQNHATWMYPKWMFVKYEGGKQVEF